MTCRRMMALSNLFELIQNNRFGPRMILGIDGLSRSGKTTFTERLRTELLRAHNNVCVFHMDDHIVERKRRYDTGHESWYEYYALQWEVEPLRENLFSKLRRSDEIGLQFYNDELDERFTKTISIPLECVVIVEGVFLQRPEWREYIDYCIYLDCPREIRFAHESIDAQSKLEKFKNRYWKAEDHYLDLVRPLDRADMVVES